ncbi:hypothetical protein SE336_15865 [Xanthomonas arboricola]|uniref:hypothetical protein n=1 Tax=Xanthomonas arboricola TaxID=56448 RepID=UPI0039F4F57E
MDSLNVDCLPKAVKIWHVLGSTHAKDLDLEYIIRLHHQVANDDHAAETLFFRTERLSKPSKLEQWDGASGVYTPDYPSDSRTLVQLAVDQNDKRSATISSVPGATNTTPTQRLTVVGDFIVGAEVYISDVADENSNRRPFQITALDLLP